MYNDVPGHWVDMWRSKAVFWTHKTSPRLTDVEYSLICSFLGMCHSSTRPPNVQVCHCTWSVYQAFLCLVLQATNGGVREPGYEAMTYIHTRPQTSLATAFGKHSISTDGLVHAAVYSTTDHRSWLVKNTIIAWSLKRWQCTPQCT